MEISPIVEMTLNRNQLKLIKKIISLTTHPLLQKQTLFSAL